MNNYIMMYYYLHNYGELITKAREQQENYNFKLSANNEYSLEIRNGEKSSRIYITIKPFFSHFSLEDMASGSLKVGRRSAPFLEYSLHLLAAAAARFALSFASSSGKHISYCKF